MNDADKNFIWSFFLVAVGIVLGYSISQLIVIPFIERIF